MDEIDDDTDEEADDQEVEIKIDHIVESEVLIEEIGADLQDQETEAILEKKELVIDQDIIKRTVTIKIYLQRF